MRDPTNLLKRFGMVRSNYWEKKSLLAPLSHVDNKPGIVESGAMPCCSLPIQVQYSWGLHLKKHEFSISTSSIRSTVTFSYWKIQFIISTKGGEVVFVHAEERERERRSSIGNSNETSNPLILFNLSFLPKLLRLKKIIVFRSYT